MTSKLVNSLIDGFNKYSNRTLVSFKKDFVYDRYRYQDIYDSSLKFITLLKQYNIKKGDRIAICSYNNPQYFYVFLGSLFHGSILVPVDYGSSPELVKKFMKKTNCKLLITSRFKLIHTTTKKLYIEDLPELLIKKKKSKINPKTRDDDLCQILFTSGTTGEPKGVMITHNNIHSNLLATLEVIKITKKYKLMSLLPLSHIFEQIAGFLILIITGAQTVQLKSRRPSEIVKVFKKEKTNCLATVPAFLNLFRKKIEDRAKEQGQYKKLQRTLSLAKKLPIPLRRTIFKKIHKTLGGKLKRIVCGAAPLSKETELFWESIGLMVIQAYGLTEASPVLTISDEKHRRRGAVGKAIPGVRIRLSEKNEILALGNNITQGYYKNPTATKNLFDKGWLRTGDIGQFDNDGYLYIKGRLKNMILKPSGLNVYPEDIEKILDSCEDIKESCVLGIEKGNDVVITAVLLLKNNLPDKKVKRLIAHINKKLEFHQKVQDHIIWKKQDFPRTLTLKVKRHYVLKEIEEKTHVHTESKDRLIHLLSELSHVDAKEIKENSNLYTELGFDSLKTIELAASIEERLGVEIDEYMIDAKTSVKRLKNIIEKGKDQKNILKLDKKMFSIMLKPVKVIWPVLSFFFISKFFTKFEVEGLENLKKIDGQVIIVTNHLSHLDSPTIMKHLPLKIRTKLAAGAAADYFFKHEKIKHIFVSKFFSYILGAFPMSRDKDIENRTSVRKSFEFVGEIVDRGWSIALAPEGTRSRTGKMNPFKNGIGIIVKETNLPCLPVRLRGLWDILPPGKNWPIKKAAASIKFGKPMYFSSKLTPVEITQQLEKTIRAM